MDKETADAWAEQQAREIKNLKVVKESGIEYERNEIIERAKEYSGLIKTVDDLFQHMERLQKCSMCRKDFYDKLCPDCSHKTKEKNK